MGPPALIRATLAECRRRGWAFDPAFELALRSLARADPEGGEWRAVCHELRDVWRDAYERNGAVRGRS
jgi:hypothetical protein